MYWYFVFFIISGFCSLVYQVTWMRVAMAAFGVTTPLVAMVISIFMAGLALGSWGGGLLAERLEARSPRLPLRFYAGAEAIIGLSGIVVAPLLRLGHSVLLSSSGADWGSGRYYLASGVLVTAALLPFCTCMGATFPLAMASVRRAFADKSATSFSYLYVANVLGAIGGGLSAAFILIELLGFRGTMLGAAGLNMLVALLALAVSAGTVYGNEVKTAPDSAIRPVLPLFQQPRFQLLLFMTGLVSMGMEVVWSRQFIPYLGPVVYTFAAILAIYLAATLVGAEIYRVRFREHLLLTCSQGWQVLIVLSAATALFPLLVTDHRVTLFKGILPNLVLTIIGIGPFCAVLGFMTPALLDRVSSGNPRKAGIAYAINTVGCIAGPLLTVFLLLPCFGERWSLVLLALLLFSFGVLPIWSSQDASSRVMPVKLVRKGIVALILFSAATIGLTGDYEQLIPDARILRDHTATVIAWGKEFESMLLVNGVGMTKKTPITKMMVHLPLASLESPPRNGLVLCLGMGTSFRSMMSWGIPTTVVELVPSVPSLLPFFHDDGGDLLTSPLGKVVVDDARRFLERSHEQFSVIVIDPPPPIEAAASSLLYSKEFYANVAMRLAPDGIMQQWIPWNADGFDEKLLVVSMLKAISEVFPHLRVYRSLEGWGQHVLASKKPLPMKAAAQLASFIPAKAAADLLEWGPNVTVQEQFNQVVSQEETLRELIALSPAAPVLTDDRPLNEYYLLRKYLRSLSE